jgi:hypothetical protein
MLGLNADGFQFSFCIGADSVPELAGHGGAGYLTGIATALVCWMQPPLNRLQRVAPAVPQNPEGPQ